MTREEFEKNLEAFASRLPFKPFTVELRDGTRIEIDRPHATCWGKGEGKAIFMGRGRKWLNEFDPENTVRFFDTPESDTPRIQRSKPMNPLLENAIRAVREAQEELVSLYLNMDPDDEGYEVAVAETKVPKHLADLSHKLHAAHVRLLDLDDEGRVGR